MPKGWRPGLGGPACRRRHARHRSVRRKIPVPGDGGYDFVYLDVAAHRLYVAHNTEMAGDRPICGSWSRNSSSTTWPRFHQGLGGQLIRKQVGPTNDNGAAGKIARRSGLGGVLNYYSREAAW